MSVPYTLEEQLTFQRLEVERWRTWAQTSTDPDVPAALKVAEAVLQTLETDARRYQWLRDQEWFFSDLFVIRGGKDCVKLGTDCPRTDRLDRLIDAELEKEKKS